MTNHHISQGPGIPRTGGGYSPAVVVGDTCFVSGQLPLDPATGEVVDGTLSDELRQTLTNLEATLAAAGFAIDELVSTTVVLTDIADWQELDDAWRQFFGGRPLPARMVFGADGLALGAHVEVQAVAARTRAS